MSISSEDDRVKCMKEDSDMVGSYAAMIRAARRARELARQHNQPLALWKDGKVVLISPDDLPPLPDEVPAKSEQP
ncbi:MAG: hypothetical protein U5N86_11430 [Planctomycetota bacterium]|nr:hypothetical protein [Planctomycetota bacterium]